MTGPSAPTARDLWWLLEPVHAVTYFSPEPLAALRDAGYRGFWMGYFAGRAAPLGAAPPDVVHALFYNFDTAHVARALPDAWHFAPPEAALTARSTGSVAALRRHLAAADPNGGVDDALARTADLALRAADAAPPGGRALFAANRSLPTPDDPLGRLWHAATLLREHRGDGHVIALAAHGVDGREAHVLTGLATGTPQEVYAAARNLDPATWNTLRDGLRDRGLVDDDGLTEAGHALRQRIEDLTDELAGSAFTSLDDGELAALADGLRPVARAVVAAGEIPARSPMGLDLTEPV